MRVPARGLSKTERMVSPKATFNSGRINKHCREARHEMTKSLPLSLAARMIDAGKNDVHVQVGGEAKFSVHVSSPLIHPFQEAKL